MEYLIRFVQVHETFRLAEIRSLALLADIKVDILQYDEYVCFDLQTSVIVYGPRVNFSNCTTPSALTRQSSSPRSALSRCRTKNQLGHSSVGAF